jgi:flagellar hook-associated protein 3 FlgL
MRVNPNMAPDVLAAIWQTQRQEQTALQEMSTGKRVNAPSDDPLASAEMVGNQDQSTRVDQYLQNIVPSTIMQALPITFSSSRIFPGQE